MSTFRKLEALQEEKVRLKAENASLVERNKRLVAENEQLHSDIKLMAEKTELAKRAIEELKVTYKESIAIARESQEKYTELYKECLVLKKSLLKAKV